MDSILNQHYHQQLADSGSESNDSTTSMISHNTYSSHSFSTSSSPLANNSEINDCPHQHSNNTDLIHNENDLNNNFNCDNENLCSKKIRQMFSVSKCLNFVNNKSKYSNIEMLLDNQITDSNLNGSPNNLTKNNSFIKKKNSSTHRKTIRNIALAANAHEAEKSSSSLLLFRSSQIAKAHNNSDFELNKKQIKNTFYHSSTHYHQDIMNASASNNTTNISKNHHNYEHAINESTNSIDETANLRLLVEVAVGLWEEQQRNYEFRN